MQPSDPKVGISINIMEKKRKEKEEIPWHGTSQLLTGAFGKIFHDVVVQLILRYSKTSLYRNALIVDSPLITTTSVTSVIEILKWKLFPKRVSVGTGREECIYWSTATGSV